MFLTPNWWNGEENGREKTRGSDGEGVVKGWEGEVTMMAGCDSAWLLVNM